MSIEDELYAKGMQKSQFGQAVEKQQAGQVPLNEFGEPEYQIVQGAIDNWKNPKEFKENPIAKWLYEGATETRPGAALVGWGEGVHDLGKSAANAFLSDENKIQDLGTEELINPEYRGYHQASRLGSNIVNTLVLNSMLGGAMGGLTGMGGTAARMGATAGMDYLLGENFPEWLGGRMGAGVGGLLFPVSPIWGGASSSAIGRNVVRAAENAEARYGGRIGEVLSHAQPITNPRATRAMRNVFRNDAAIGEEYGIRTLMRDFFTNPTAQGAQDVMSTMKRAQREMLNHAHPRVSSLPAGSQEVYRDLGRAVDSFERIIQRSLSPEQFRDYQRALRDYAGHAAPYKQPAITRARTTHGIRGTEGAIPKAIKRMEESSRTLPTELGQDVMTQYEYLMRQHPELFINKYSPAAGLAVGGAAGKEALDYFKSLFGGGEGNTQEY